MIKSKILIFVFVGFFNAQLCIGQERNTYAVLNGLSSKIDSNIPIVDSLYPSKLLGLLKREQKLFTKKEVNELRKNLKRSVGFKLKQDSINWGQLIPAKPLMNFIYDSDSSNLKLVEKSKPFCIISAPIFFNNNSKVLISIDVIGSYGYSYIMQRVNDKWIILKEIFRWVV
jgi:hypothetical protein